MKQIFSVRKHSAWAQLLLLLLTISACKSRNSLSGQTEFVNADLGAAEAAADIQLNYLLENPQAQKAGLSPWQIIATRQKIYGSSLYQTQVSFKDLSAAQFETLQAIYGAMSELKSRVPYHEQKTFVLSDFLPPIFQAMEAAKFIPQEENVEHLAGEVLRTTEKKVPGALKTTANCWGTVWEIIRHRKKNKDDSFALFYEETKILDQLRNPGYSEQIASILLKEPISNPAKLAELPQKRNKPGDILIITSAPKSGTAQTFIHAAVWLDFNLYFEKTGIDSRTSYRFTTLKEILELYGPKDGVHRQLEWRRFNGAALPHPKEIFSDRPTELSDSDPYPHFTSQKNARGILFGWPIVDVPFSYDESTGRAKLAEKDTTKSSFYIDKSCLSRCFQCKGNGFGKHGDSFSFEVPLVNSEMQSVYIRIYQQNEGKSSELTPTGGLKLQKMSLGAWSGVLNGQPVHFDMSQSSLEWRAHFGDTNQLSGKSGCRFVR